MYIPIADLDVSFSVHRRSTLRHLSNYARQIAADPNIDPIVVPGGGSNTNSGSSNTGTNTQQPPTQSSNSGGGGGQGNCLQGGSVAGIVIGCIVGTLFIIWLIYLLRGTKGEGYTHGSAGTANGARRYSGYEGDEMGKRRHSRRGSDGVYEAREGRSRSRVYEAREGRSRSRVYEARERRGGGRDEYEAVEKTVKPAKVVYRD